MSAGCWNTIDSAHHPPTILFSLIEVADIGNLYRILQDFFKCVYTVGHKSSTNQNA